MKTITKAKLVNCLKTKKKLWNRYKKMLNRTNLSDINLSGVNLADADLTGADLRKTNLKGANLTGADLTGANLDFSCLSLSCKTLNIGKTDKRLSCQLLYHFYKFAEKCDDKEIQELLKDEKFINLANQFHRINECEKIEL